MSNTYARDTPCRMRASRYHYAAALFNEYLAVCIAVLERFCGVYTANNVRRGMW